MARQGYLTHGRIDGDIPPKKRKEFEEWQAKLKKQHGSLKPSGTCSGVTLTDGAGFDEKSWRNMGRGAGESERAFRYRTGHQAAPENPEGKAPRRKASASCT
eukprot:TRINITY_DN21384_c0_g1_i1.p1 TRINITY_DN21384_c0_g1~~TRINITY_DN21384_c0_g1_i1.p1  ORF type:complete len:115 (-),score=24.94 TRINITY_DN21384_c0_g1_i1:124-429(-)